jgi:hypothetical protein
VKHETGVSERARTRTGTGTGAGTGASSTSSFFSSLRVALFSFSRDEPVSDARHDKFAGPSVEPRRLAEKKTQWHASRV